MSESHLVQVYGMINKQLDKNPSTKSEIICGLVNLKNFYFSLIGPTNISL